MIHRAQSGIFGTGVKEQNSTATRVSKLMHIFSMIYLKDNNYKHKKLVCASLDVELLVNTDRNIV